MSATDPQPVLPRAQPSPTQDLLEEAVRIQAITAEVTALEDPEAIPAAVVQALVQTLGIPVASLVLRDPETGQLHYAADHGVPAEAKAMGFRPGGTADQVLTSGEALFVEDAEEDPRVHAAARRIFQAWACLPVRHRAQTFGLLYVNFTEPHAFPPLERHILRIFASQTGIALDNARLQRSLRQQSDALAALAALGRDLVSSLETREILRVVHRALTGHLPGTTTCRLWILAEGTLQPVLALGADLAHMPVLEANRAVNGPARGRGLMDLTPFGFAAEQGHVVPLRAGEELQGLLTLSPVTGKDALEGAPLDFVQALADRAALALHNAEVYARTLQASRRDSLTQLLNHGAFQARMAEVLPQQTGPRSAALLMIDADHFKRCNDTYGHTFGDQVLVALAGKIREQVRPTDPVGRWGGEEFSVLVPDLDLEGGLRVAERIRAAMERLVLQLPDGREVPAPTVSLGVSAFPECANQVGDLVTTADVALYRAKAEGRNCVRPAPRLTATPARG